MYVHKVIYMNYLELFMNMNILENNKSHGNELFIISDESIDL